MSTSRTFPAIAAALALVLLAAEASAQQCGWSNTTVATNLCPVGIGTTGPATQFHVTRSSGDVWAMFQRQASTNNLAIFFRTASDSSTDWIIGKRASSEHLYIGYGTFANTPVTLEQDGELILGNGFGRARLTVHETRDEFNHQLVLSNGGVRHTGFIALSSTGSVHTDPAAWGLFGGPNAYLSGAANRVVMPLAADVPGFVVTRVPNLNSAPQPGDFLFTILREGRVGINTVTPGVGTGRPVPNTTALDVVGDVYVQGTVRGTNVVATYQDVAEWVVGDGNLTAGTVVIVAPDQRDVVTASSEPYDTRVAGVVSEMPGVLLGVPGESKVKVATTGRVKVKVDATAAPIRAGDVLVTSPTPGTAMKSEPIEVGTRRIHQPGTIIGKALEPLEKGRGEILVLLSLQ